MRYPGGKGRCYHKIVSMMPRHRVYIETHLGGGAVLLHKRAAQQSIGIDADPAALAAWRDIDYPSLQLQLGDAAAYLRSYAFLGDELVYSDPPYLAETRRRPRLYRHEYTREQHCELLTLLKTLPCMVMVSGYRSRLYDEMLEGWTSVEFVGDSHVGPTTEVVWRNYDEVPALHDYEHLGDNFRAREAIRRRRAMLSRRIDGLPPFERQALFELLAERHAADYRHPLTGELST